jgi:hypothetical protein
MGIFGRAIGSALGAGIGSFWGKETDGAGVGATVGSWLPFQKGGRVMALPNYTKGGIVRPVPPAKMKGYTKGGLVVGRDAFGGIVTRPAPKRR